MKHPDWGEAGVDLPRAGPRQLDRYEALLRDRALRSGMIAPGDEPALRERHLIDSLRASPLLGEISPGGGIAVDLGSGAGLPGIPLAIARPEMRFVLAENRRSRVAFLELVLDTLDLSNVTIHPRGAELVPPDVDACLARAFGDITRSWAVASPLLRVRGSLLYWAGRRWRPLADPPANATLQVGGTSGLANTGPIVIMSRQW